MSAKRARHDGNEDNEELSDFQAEIKQILQYANDIKEEEEDDVELKFPVAANPPVPNKVISSYANKGGVGKTSLSIMMAETLYYDKKCKNVLILDFDSQISLTSMLETDLKQQQTFNEIDAGITDPNDVDSWQSHNVIGVLRKAEIELKELVPTFMNYLTNDTKEYKIDYMKGHIDHDYINNELAVAMRIRQPNFMMRSLMKLINICKNGYDIVILDLSPSLTPMNVVLMKLSNHIISPVLPDLHATLSARALQRKFLSQQNDLKFITNNEPIFSGFVVNRVRHYGGFIIKEMMKNIFKLQRFAVVNGMTGVIGSIKFMPSLNEILQMNDGYLKNLISAGENDSIPARYSHLYQNVRQSLREILTHLI